MVHACNRGVLSPLVQVAHVSAFTVATTLVCVLLMASPIAATPSPPVKVGEEVLVNSHAPEYQYYPDATRRPDKKWIVVWASNLQDGSNYGIYMQMYNADHTKYGGEVQVHTNTLHNQNVPRVAAAPDNSFVVTWYSYHKGSPYLVQSQRFNSNGGTVGGEFTINTGSGHAYYADVTYLTSGDVVYCWRDYSTGTHRTMIRRYDSNFSPLGEPVEVNDDPSQRGQYWPRIAALAGGGFVVVYYGPHTGSSEEEIKGQVYSATATKVGPAIQLNAFTTGSQRYPQAAGLPDGGFIVAWDSYNQDGSEYACVARHFASDGTPITDEFIVNSVTANVQQRPTVTTFSDNSFAIAWYGYWRDSGADDVALQYFDASHNKIGDQILVHARDYSWQLLPAIASTWDDGEIGVFYASHELAGGATSYDIGGQWFLVDVPPTTQLALPCTSACLQYFCPTGKLIDIKVKGVVSNDVWGADHFSDDSNVAAAAVFAGLVAQGETATVTVKCSGPKPSFTSASANGITTQAFASSWPSSFTFDLGGETQAPPPPSPPRCFHEPCAHGKCKVQGTFFDITVKGVASNNVWGSEEFSDDSWVGAAAVHQGLLEAGSVGSVTVTCAGARTALTGSSRNGVTSNSFGPWPFTYVVHAGPTAAPVPTADVCVGACLEGNCPENRELFLRVHGATSGYLWGGRAPYTSDTTVSAAAVHAGLVTAGSTGIVKATCSGSQSSFTGSSQNGVTTASYGPWSESFTLSAGTTMPTVTCGAGEQCLKDECSVKGRVIKVSVTGSTHSATQFWGTALFTGDSPPSHAAVHAGLIAEGELSILYATCQGPHDSFAGSDAHGVTSTEWNAPWPGSFTLSTIL